MKYRLDPTAPQGISRDDDDKIIPYFQDRVGKPSLIDSVNGKHGAVEIIGGTNITVDNSGKEIKISASGGGGGGAVDSVNGQTGTVVLDPDDLDDTSTSHKFVTATDLTTLSNTSGTNTGDQDLSGYALTSSLATVATSGDYDDLTNKPAIPSTFDDLTDGTTNKAFTSTLKNKLDGIEAGAEVNTVDSVNGQTGAVTLDADDVLPTQTGNSGKYLGTNGTTASWQTLAGGGDMAAATYDPQNIADDAFDRGNHTGTQTASTISDLSSAISGNSDVSANTAARHAAVTVTDSSEIDFTLTGQDITASLKAASIDESKLDTSVNASLDLADSSTQPGDNISSLTNDSGFTTNTGTVTSVAISGSDGIEIDSGSPVTSSGTIALGVSKTGLLSHINVEDGADVTDEANVKAAIDGMTLSDVGTPASGDRVLLQDSSDSNSLKYADFSDFGGGGGSGDVVGPASAIDNAIVVFDGAGGKTIKQSIALSIVPGQAKIQAANGYDMTLATGLGGNINLTADDLIVVTNDNILTNIVHERTAAAGVTIDGVLIKDGEVDGVDVSALETTVGTKITGFTDPNADRIVFWDDSAGAYAALTPSTGLTVSGTNMTVRSASATQTGIVELATTAETETGTDATRAVTPDGLHDMTTLAGAAWFLDEDAMTSNSATKVASQQSIKAYVDAAIDASFLAANPIGTRVLGPDNGANPNTYIRGCSGTTWARVEGKFIVGVSDSDTDFDVNDTGGAKTHTLTTTEMPSHNHVQSYYSGGLAASGSSLGGMTGGAGAQGISGQTTQNAGSGGAHNNLPPFEASYVWKRTA